MRERLRQFARLYLVADTPPMPAKARWQSAFGALLGVLITGALIVALPGHSLWLMAAVGSTSVILFAQPHSPLAQPWPVLGGYLVAVACGLLMAALIPVPAVAGALGLGIAVWLMSRLRCVHPPGGAIVLVVVAEGTPTLLRSGALFGVAIINVLILVGSAWLINNHLLGRRYPQCRTEPATGPHGTHDATPLVRTGLQHEDLLAALEEEDSFVDVQETELVSIYERAVRHAFERHMATSCGQLMARDLVTVEFATPLDEAWSLLQEHRIKALPVIDRFHRLIGIVTVSDFLRQLGDARGSDALGKLQGLLLRTPGPNSQKAEVVGQIMSQQVITARETTPVSALIERFADRGIHHVPVVDDSNKLLGMVGRSDLLAALYRRVALEAA